jgi:hypothetical protein
MDTLESEKLQGFDPVLFTSRRVVGGGGNHASSGARPGAAAPQNLGICVFVGREEADTVRKTTVAQALGSLVAEPGCPSGRTGCPRKPTRR